MMKKLAAMLLTGVMALSLAACGGSSGAATSNDSTEATGDAAEAPAAEEAAPAADATDENTFVVGFDAEYPPYGYLDEATGDYTGFDLQMAEELCKRRGWTLVKQPINWDNKDAELDSGSIDCIWNGMTCSTPERVNAYTWSKPYVNNSIVIAVMADSEIQTPADLAGKVVIAQSNSSAEDALKSDELKELAGSFAELQRNPSYDTCFMDLKTGAVDAVAVDIGVARFQLRNNPDTFGAIPLSEFYEPEEPAKSAKKREA